MAKYKCKMCNKIIETDNFEELECCPFCGSNKELIEKTDEEESSPIITGPIPISKNNPGIERIEEKCIKCGLCSKICQNKVGIHYDPKKSKEPVCISCGQCSLNCPVGAILPKYSYKKVMNYINDTDKVVIAFTAPAVRVALGEEFLSEDDNVEKKMVTALKELGFNYVFDTTFGADLTIMEEASELLERLKENKNIPQFTSCCPGWVRYLEIYHPKLLKYLSTCKSPISMQGSMIKNYFSEMAEIPKENIITVAVTPCTSKKSEILNYNDDTNFVITTSELAMMIREKEIDFNNLKDTNFDHIMQRGSGAGIIFGSSGGVMEAALRTAYYFVNKKNPPRELLNLEDVRGYNNLKEATVTIGNNKLNVLVVYGLTNIEPILKELENGNCKYHFIEVMNCPGGCVGGGGQPLGIVSKQKEVIEKRIKSLYNEDSDSITRNSYENQDIIDIYSSYLEKPLSKKAIDLLHTTYEDKSDILG